MGDDDGREGLVAQKITEALQTLEEDGHVTGFALMYQVTKVDDDGDLADKPMIFKSRELTPWAAEGLYLRGARWMSEEGEEDAE